MINFSEKESLSVRFPLSIFNSKALKKAVASITQYHWDLPLQELERLARPTEADIRLRRRYWQIASAAAAKGTKHTLGELHVNICTYTHLYNNILTNPYKVCWILKPSFETKSEIEELQNKMFDTLKAILSLDNVHPDGSRNYANVDLKMNIFPLIFNLSDNDFKYL